jgi:hypothetical protein
MLSLVLYGRNDNYGYNLHKRAALSLNCMAEVLTGETDEIIFVDYNTPDDFPTFPEALADTLTEKARSLLRIIRVRPEIHRQRFESRTHLKAVESVSRNVAIRRSNPANRWILSTNTDMIFVPRRESSLTEAVVPFGDGFYCAPRIEIPETLWESYDRLDPAGVIAETRHWGSAAHLDEIVYGSDTILYDGPGDFQLILRKDLFEIHGFHEGMLLGWHLDSNIFKRLGFVHESIGDAAQTVFGYHCDHTRQVTPAHAHKSPENDQEIFVDGVTSAPLPDQSYSWGLADLELEEVSLDRSVNRTFRRALSLAISEPLTVPLRSYYQSATYDKTSAEPEHILPFLLDIFSNFPRNKNVLWLGQGDRLFELFRRCWGELGFVGQIIIDQDSGAKFENLDGVSGFIFNFGSPTLLEGEESAFAKERFLDVVIDEVRHQNSDRPPRRFVGVNAIHNRFEGLIVGNIGCAKTPFSTRLRHGFLLPEVRAKLNADASAAASAAQQTQNWTSQMRVGGAGVRKGDLIATRRGNVGHFVYGPYLTLRPGEYRICIGVNVSYTLKLLWSGVSRQRCALTVELVFDENVQEIFNLSLNDILKHSFQFPVLITKRDSLKQIQLRISSHDVTDIALESVVVEPTNKSAPPQGRILTRARAN